MRRLRFKLVKDGSEAGFVGNGPLEGGVGITNGALCCSLEKESQMHRGRLLVSSVRERTPNTKLAELHTRHTGMGNGVNGLLATGKAMI